MKNKFVLCLLFCVVLLFGIGEASAITGRLGNSRMVLNVNIGEIVERNLVVDNVNDVPITISLSASGDLANNINFLNNSIFVLLPGEERKVYFTIFANEPGTSETKIDVLFKPENETGTGLSSIIIVRTSQELEEKKTAIISADLESGKVIAGEKVVVGAVITNLQSHRSAFVVNVYDYQLWAKLDSVSPPIVDLEAGESEEVLIIFEIDNDVEGEQSFEIEAQSSLGGSESREIGLMVKKSISLCKYSQNNNDIEIKKIQVKNRGEGDKGEWNLLDDVEIAIDIENNGDDDLEEIIVELGLFDNGGNNQISDLEFDNEDEEQFDLGDLDEGDDATAIFIFRVPADFEDGNYKLTAKAYSDDLGENELCVDKSTDFKEEDKYNDIDIRREDDEDKFIAFDNIELTPTEATCGDRVSMTLGVYNIGDEDQDRVKITLKNAELGIDEFVEIKNFDEGEKKKIRFEPDIPNNITNGTYTLLLSARYGYEDGDYGEELRDKTTVELKVGECKPIFSMGDILSGTGFRERIELNKRDPISERNGKVMTFLNRLSLFRSN